MSRITAGGKALFRPSCRLFSTAEKRSASAETVAKMKARQQKFQIDTGEEVHMKAGKTHFYVTTVLGILAVGNGLHSLYKIIQKN